MPESKQRMRKRWSVAADPSARVGSRRAPRVYDRWRDVDGTHVPVGARVAQTVTDARMGALGEALIVLHTVVNDWPI